MGTRRTHCRRGGQAAIHPAGAPAHRLSDGAGDKQYEPDVEPPAPARTSRVSLPPSAFGTGLGTIRTDGDKFGHSQLADK